MCVWIEMHKCTQIQEIKLTLTQFKLKAIFKTFTLERNVQTDDNFKHQDLNYSG